MNAYSRSFLTLALGLIVILGATGAADARWGGPHHGGGYGYGHGYGYGYGAQAPSPEAQKLMDASYNAIAPLDMELRAKQDELTAKIYSGADAKTIDALSKEVGQLQVRLTEARVAMQQQFAKGGIPIQHVGRGNCSFAGGGMYRGYGPCFSGGAPVQVPRGE